MVQTPTVSTPATATVKIDFLYFEDCPSHERALELLREVIQEEGLQSQVEIRKVETDEEAEALRFPGSPTIRVNGLDIDQHADLTVGLACRAYRRADGRISPLPPKDRITRAIRNARRSEEA